jgi:phytoene synthase
MAPMTDEPPELLARLREQDWDRYFCTLFAPTAARPALATLYAFNHELARAREVTTEPTLALMRLQWWREVVEGATRRHEVASPLAALIAEGRADPALLEAMIAAREAEVARDGEIASEAELVALMRQGPGSLAVAAGRLLAVMPADAENRLRDVGAAYGLAGTLRNAAAMARAGRCLLPVGLLAEAGLSVHEAMARPDAAVAAVSPALRRAVERLLREAGDLPRAVLPAALIGVLARWQSRGLGARVAVAAAVARGKIG